MHVGHFMRILCLSALGIATVACAKKNAYSEGDEDTMKELRRRFDEAIGCWNLDGANSILSELSKLETPRDRVNNARISLASRLIEPQLFKGAPVTLRRSFVHFATVGALGGPSETISCSTEWQEKAIYNRNPGRALELFRAAGQVDRELEAAYLTGDLMAFEDAWTRIPQQDSSGDHGRMRARMRARLLFRASKFEQALDQARKNVKTTTENDAHRCQAHLLTARIHETRKAFAAARSAYELAQTAESFGNCHSTARARLEALEGIGHGKTLPAFGVRLVLDSPADAKVKVVLKAHHPGIGHVNLSGWMNDNDPSSWHNNDTFFAIEGKKDADGAWQFNDVPRGWWSIVVIVDGLKAARPKSGQCIAGVHLIDQPVEAGPLAIVWHTDSDKVKKVPRQ